jgi:dihydrofolate reductase
MTKVIADISVSIDGFVTGPDVDLEHGLGHGGEPLHKWVFDGNEANARVVREAYDESGAVIMGRRLFDIIDGPHGWSDEMGYGAEHAGRPPFFVVTHVAPETVRLDLDFTFVTGGIVSAVERARAAAGAKNVIIMGGADVIRQGIDAELVDELRVHLSPIILGAGTPLFDRNVRREVTQIEVRSSETAVHITYGLRPEILVT